MNLKFDQILFDIPYQHKGKVLQKKMNDFLENIFLVLIVLRKQLEQYLMERIFVNGWYQMIIWKMNQKLKLIAEN